MPRVELLFNPISSQHHPFSLFKHRCRLREDFKSLVFYSSLISFPVEGIVVYLLRKEMYFILYLEIQILCSKRSIIWRRLPYDVLLEPKPLYREWKTVRYMEDETSCILILFLFLTFPSRMQSTFYAFFSSCSSHSSVPLFRFCIKVTLFVLLSSPYLFCVQRRQ